MTLRRNALGQLGFHVNFEGIVAEVEPYGYAWQAGLRQGSRLVEICKVSVASLSHEQMIDLLRTSVTVKVVIIPPHEDSTPRRYGRVDTHMLYIDRRDAYVHFTCQYYPVCSLIDFIVLIERGLQ